jgi:hypothetical protein
MSLKRAILFACLALAPWAAYSATPTFGNASNASCSTGNYTATADSEYVVVQGVITFATTGSGAITAAQFAADKTATVAGGTVNQDQMVTVDGPTRRTITFAYRIKTTDLYNNVSSPAVITPTLTVTGSPGSVYGCTWHSVDISAGTTLALDNSSTKSQTTSSSTATDFQNTYAVANNTIQFTGIGLQGSFTSTPAGSFSEARDGTLNTNFAIAIHTKSTATGATITYGLATIGGATAGGLVSVSYVESVTAPTFSVSTTVSSQDDNDYTLAYTSSTIATFYAVGYETTLSAPNCTQIKAGKNQTGANAIASANEAVTGADTTVLSIPGTPRPIHNIASCLSNAGGDSPVVTLTNKALDAPAGKQYVTLASVSATSWCKDFNDAATPDIAAGDIIKIDSATTPGAFTWTQGTDCDGSYSGDASRQSLAYDVYDTSVGDYMSGGPGTLWFNNATPEVADPSEPVAFFVPLNSAMTPVDLTTLCTDGDGDSITVTAVDALPSGLSISSSTLQGTATAQGIYSDLTFRCTDTAGASVDFQ